MGTKRRCAALTPALLNPRQRGHLADFSQTLFRRVSIEMKIAACVNHNREMAIVVLVDRSYFMTRSAFEKPDRVNSRGDSFSKSAWNKITHSATTAEPPS
jgi:hypothetical protein